MATPFLDVYSLFSLLNQDKRFLETLSAENQEEILQSLLLKSAIDFYECKTDLTFDLESKSFKETLDQDEQYILAEFMRLYWTQRLLYDEKNLRIQLGDRDYKMFSPTNHLKALSELETKTKNELKKRIIKYKNKSTLWGRSE